MQDLDTAIRLAAFQWLSEQTRIHGDVLPRTLLAQGFPYNGERIHLVSRQGIFKPKNLKLPLSLTTSPSSTYHDSLDENNLVLRYHYRGTDPMLLDNRLLRAAQESQKPLVYFFGLSPNHYLAIWPVYIVGEDRQDCLFTAVVESATAALRSPNHASLAEPDIVNREYVTRLTLQRVHQRKFRENVLLAYSVRCALCRLRHYELLDAAHIIQDRDPRGIPSVTNGLSLCKLHHAAYDSNIISVTPNYIIEVRPDVLDEDDGPMLQHGLKELHDRRIYLPKRPDQWPDHSFLEERHDRFRKAS